MISQGTEPATPGEAISYIRQQNIFFVPILRHRLNFAVLVRRALRQLGPWTDQDLIAVALPPSVGVVVRMEVQGQRYGVLPVSLVIANWEDGIQQEVFPVTPCDGIVEAVRVASERDLPLEFIDQELSPGNLVMRQCLLDPQWPDDDLVLRWGSLRYLRLITEQIEQPPIRFEPVDTWREIHMAEALRALSPKYSRVLAVCEATHLEPIRRLLRVGSRESEVSVDAGAEPRLKVVRPTLEVMLRYLDDFPKLVERYEEQRRFDHVADFDKWRELFSIFQGVEGSMAGHLRSARRLEVFRRYLLYLLEQNKRISPRPYEISEASKGCFGTGLTSRIMAQLGGYSDEIDLERIGDIPTTGKSVYLIQTRESRSGEPYVSRSCNPIPTIYQVTPRPARIPGSSASLQSSVFGPRSPFTERMRSKALNLASMREQEVRTSVFRGSLEGGIDPRRSLRSLLSGTTTLYVKKLVHRELPKDFSSEPIVWLFRPVKTENWSSYSLRCTLIGEEEGPQFPQKSSYLGEDTIIFESKDRKMKIVSREVLGFVSFFEDETIEGWSRSRIDEFSRRIGDHSEAMTPFTTMGCTFKDLERYVDAEWPWWVILLLMGLRCAKEALICVVPDSFRMPPEVVSASSAQGKQIICTRTMHFSRNERNKLMVQHTVYLPPGANEDKAVKQRLWDVVKKLGLAWSG
jgi:hypothetical protein